MNAARAENKIAFRSAGSHSPIDVVTIDQQHRIIELIQCKPDSMSDTQKKRLESKLADVTAVYRVVFKVI